PLASTRPVLNTAPAASAPETSLPRPIATRLPSTPAQPPAPGPLAPPPQVALPVAKSAPTRTVQPLEVDPPPALAPVHAIVPETVAAAAPWTAPPTQEEQAPVQAAALETLELPPAPVAMDASEAADVAKLQGAVVAALSATKGQTSAAEQLEDSTWTCNGNTIEIQTTLSKTMLPVIVNVEADRILKAILRDHGGMQFAVKLLPGSSASNGKTGAAKTRIAASGSAAELAEKHPLVQEARRLFSAEISKVIDLRGKD
ncbi:MAG: hypothetical protein ACRYFU_11225, partial [Janthinobacterium lividum]